MSLLSLFRSRLVAIAGTILLFALVFVVALLLNGFPYLPWNDWRAFVGIAVFFGVLGAFYGTIVALDRESGMAKEDRPLLRTVLCGALAAAAVMLVQAWPPHTFDPLGPVTGFVIGAFLGWLGWVWAKYIDF